MLITGGHPGLTAALTVRYGELPAADPSGGLDAVWWLPTGDAAVDRPAERLLLGLDAAVYNVVAPYGEGAAFAAECAARGRRWRLLQVPPIVDGATAAPSGVPRLLGSLAGVVAEVGRRQPGYFRRYPLRMAVPDGAAAPVVGPQAVAGALHRLAAQPETLDARVRLVVDRPTPVRDVCRYVEEAWRLRIEPAARPDALGPVDRYVADLLGEGWNALPAPDGARVCPVPALSAAAQVATYRAAGAEFRAEQRLADERAAALPDALDARRIVRGGVPVSYVSAGAGGPPVVVVNAIGHGLWYWYPLLERLLRRHPVLVWETRTCGLADQVDDLAAILDQEGIDECHLLGWGTGAKAAVRLYHRRPRMVRSMLFLGGAFRHPGRAPDLDSPYERELHALCTAVDRDPGRAAALRCGFPCAAADGTGDAVLAMIDPRLHDEVRRPFADPATLVGYARQHLDFWSHDATAGADRVHVPVLFCAGEYDRMVTVAGIRDAARHFPRGRFALLPGATHYRMFDRPDLVAALVERFLDEPDRVGEPAAQH